MDLHLLQDIIENPHLRIRKYESEKKLDSLKKDLKKLRVIFKFTTINSDVLILYTF